MTIRTIISKTLRGIAAVTCILGLPASILITGCVAR